jgi:xanthine dehydrogenase YagS FAD-binding subunit
MRAFDYTDPATIDEAIALLRQNGHDHERGMRPLAGVRPLAGGTDLLTLMKADVAMPSHLVNIKRLSALSGGIEDTSQGLTLGALTTLAEIETHAVIKQRYPMLAQAAAVAATPQLRNMATLGGNLLQRPRCWYFRSPRLHCWLKGGAECPAHDGENQFNALFGGGPCYAVHPSDLAPALLALGAQVQLQATAGIRMMPLAEFFSLPREDRRCETEIGDDELLLSVLLPPLPAGMHTVYVKADGPQSVGLRTSRGRSSRAPGWPACGRCSPRSGRRRTHPLAGVARRARTTRRRGQPWAVRSRGRGSIVWCGAAPA